MGIGAAARHHNRPQQQQTNKTARKAVLKRGMFRSRDTTFAETRGARRPCATSPCEAAERLQHDICKQRAAAPGHAVQAADSHRQCAPSPSHCPAAVKLLRAYAASAARARHVLIWWAALRPDFARPAARAPACGRHACHGGDGLAALVDAGAGQEALDLADVEREPA
eukprot:1111883-Prymnesium_polylepis.1